MASVVSSTLPARRRLIRDVRRLSTSPVNILFQISTCSASPSNDSLQKLPRRDYLLSIRHEDTQDDLRFQRVEALRVTHYRACTVEMVSSYDRVTDCGETHWLASVRQQLQSASEPVEGLRHLTLYLDDGPCYDFICYDFNATTTTVE